MTLATSRAHRRCRARSAPCGSAAASLGSVALLVACAAVASAERPVGVTTLSVTKASATTGAPRVLDIVVWYPAVAGTGTPEELGRRDARVQRGRHPLIVYTHGNCGTPWEATYLTTALAAQGFVVAAVPHPGSTAADFPACLGGASFADSLFNRVPDVRFALDAMLAEDATPGSRFRRRLRRRAVAVAGLSFGGFTALYAAQQEPRFRAVLALVPGGSAALGPDAIAVPAMVMGAERDQVTGYAETEMAYERLARPRFRVKLLAANHLSVVDSCVNDLGLDLCVDGDISQEKAHELVLHYAVPFMRRYLAGRRVPVRQLTTPVEGVEVRAEP